MKCASGFGTNTGSYDCPIVGGTATSTLSSCEANCDPISNLGRGVVADSNNNGCALNDILSFGMSCGVKCDTNYGYGSEFGVFTCPSGNTEAVSNLTCTRACQLDLSSLSGFKATGGSCVVGTELLENQECSFMECEEGQTWNGADVPFNSFLVRCSINSQNQPFLDPQGWECKSIPESVDDAGTGIGITTGIVGSSSALSFMFGFQVALPLQLLVAVIIDSMQFFVALSVLGGRTSSVHRHLAETFGVVLMNETSGLGPMFTALNDPIDVMNLSSSSSRRHLSASSSNDTMLIRDVKYVVCPLSITHSLDVWVCSAHIHSPSIYIYHITGFGVVRKSIEVSTCLS